MTREEAKVFLYSIAENLGFIDSENYTCKDGEKMREAIQALEERKTGKWERHYIRPGVYADLWFHATCCGGVMSFVTDYCPNCGAKMIKEGE